MAAIQQYTVYTSQVTLVVKNLPANAGDVMDTGLIPGSGRFPGEGNGNPTPVVSSGESNPMDIGPCWATDNGARHD